MNNSPHPILVIAPNWIGDAVMAQPLLEALSEQYPLAPIDIVADQWVAPVLEFMPVIRQIFKTQFARGKIALKSRWQLAKILQQQHYQSAYILPNQWKAALIPWFAGIPKRVGYIGEKRYGLLNVLHRDQNRPMVTFYRMLAETIDVPCLALEQIAPPHLIVDPKEQRSLLESLELTQNNFVVFCPGAEFGSAKRWPIEYFAQLANDLLQSASQRPIVLLGSPKENELANHLIQAVDLNRRTSVHSLIGKTTLTEAILLLSAATAVVANDSGLLHIASALSRPAIGLYGPTDTAHAPPLHKQARALSIDLACRPCKQRECPLQHHRCMRDLNPEYVHSQLLELV